MKRVVYLSSWRLFNNGQVEVPFLFDQIGSLSHIVEALYLECKFISIYRWLFAFFSGRWIVKMPNRVWKNDSYCVDHYQISLPKLPTRVTKNPLWKDFYLAGWFLAPSIQKKIGKIDVVHTHVILPMGALAAALKKRLGVPLVLQEHSGPFEMHCKTKQNAQGVQFVLRESSRILPVSISLKNIMLQYGSVPDDRYKVVPNLLRTDIFKPCKKSERGNAHLQEVRLISVCSAQKIKRHDIMFLVVQHLLDRGINVTLSIFGVDERNYELVEMRDRMNLNSYVILKGRANKQNIHEAFCNHDIYLCTSDQETFGLAPAEALCSGLPVVCSDCGGINEYSHLGNTTVVSKQDPPLYVNAIISLLTGDRSIGAMETWEKMNSRFGDSNFKKVIATIYDNL